MGAGAGGAAGGLGGAMMGGGMGGGGEGDVRAPDQTRRMRLMDFEDGGAGAGVGGMNMARMGGNLMDHPLLGPHAAMMQQHMQMGAMGVGGAMGVRGGMGVGGGMGGGVGGGMGPSRRNNNWFDDEDGDGEDYVQDMNMDTSSQEGNFRDVLNRAAAASVGVDVDGANNNGGDANADNNNDADGAEHSGNASTGGNIDEDEEVQDVTDQYVTSSTTTSTSRTISRTNRNRGPGNGSGNGASATRLRDMFAAPTHLMHTNGAGGFAGARNMAKETNRWLLVNLQSDDEFACHALNRDVWRDELCENLVTEGFIFWQSDNTTPDGQTYAQRYDVHAYPHIGILDPRTARLVYRKEGWTQVNPLTPEQFAEIAADFCSRHSFDKPPVAPSMSMSNTSTGASSSMDMGGSAGADFGSNSGGMGMGIPGSSLTAGNITSNPEAMTEEEQLQAAIRASMNDISPQMDGDNDDDDSNNGNDTSGGNLDVGADDDLDDDDESVEYVMEDDSIGDDDDDDDDGNNFDTVGNSDYEDSKVSAQDQSSMQEEEKPKEPSFQDEIVAMEVGDEPTENAASIMIRMPDGKRLVRRFGKDDVVKVIYAFVAQSNEEAKGGREFELKAGFPPKNLLDSVNESIASAGLAGESVTVRWKED